MSCRPPRTAEEGMVDDKYPLPNINNLFDKLGKLMRELNYNSLPFCSECLSVIELGYYVLQEMKLLRFSKF